LCAGPVLARCVYRQLAPQAAVSLLVNLPFSRCFLGTKK
jgi:hypothetical protein